MSNLTTKDDPYPEVRFFLGDEYTTPRRQPAKGRGRLEGYYLKQRVRPPMSSFYCRHCFVSGRHCIRKTTSLSGQLDQQKRALTPDRILSIPTSLVIVASSVHSALSQPCTEKYSLKKSMAGISYQTLYTATTASIP